jgi:3-methyladenine DNA glycosylase AlkC
MAEERKAYKDYFDRQAAKALSSQVAAAMPDFDRNGFVRRAVRNIDTLEFHGRVKLFADALYACLPDDIPESLDILTRSLPEPLPDCEAVTDGWLQWPLGQFIADHGLPHFDQSMHAMTELTQRFSSEFAVRPFVQHRPDETFAYLMSQLDHPSPHVRRWCSEGVRTRLPWGAKLNALVADPTPIWPILDALIDDDELYVRRSVANNLNDIAKDHPADAVKRAKGWLKKRSQHREWVVKHGLRTMIKNGDPAALALIGYGAPKGVSVELAIKPKKIAIGGALELNATLVSTARNSQNLLLDYIVHYVRKAGKSGSKVFKWTTLEIAAGETITLSRKHPMRQTTVRALYPGKHKVELQLNGQVVAEADFVLTE